MNESAFRRLLEIAEPRFKLPHHTCFTDTVIPAKHRANRAVIENQQQLSVIGSPLSMLTADTLFEKRN